MLADQNVEREVLAVINRLGKAFTTRSVTEGLALFADDEDVSFIGAGGAFPHTGRDAVRSILARIMSLPETFTFDWGSPTVSAAGDVAWAVSGAQITATAGGDTRSHPYRLSLLLRRRPGGWRIVHYHGSDPS